MRKEVKMCNLENPEVNNSERLEANYKKNDQYGDFFY